eukprot:5006799-Prymnesium_polylepis.2
MNDLYWRTCGGATLGYVTEQAGRDVSRRRSSQSPCFVVINFFTSSSSNLTRFFDHQIQKKSKPMLDAAKGGAAAPVAVLARRGAARPTGCRARIQHHQDRPLWALRHTITNAAAEDPWAALRQTSCDGYLTPKAASIGTYKGRVVPLLRTLTNRNAQAPRRTCTTSTYKPGRVVGQKMII